MKKVFLFIIMSTVLTYCWAGVKQKTVKVKTSEQFIKAINSDTRIIVENDLLDLTDALKGLEIYKEDDYNPAVSASDEYDGKSIHICSISNLTIEGKKAETHLQVTPRYADVLCFHSCEDITLKNLKMGHTETGDCVGNVVTLNNVNRIDITDCKLYGCGVIGIEANQTDNITVKNSDIYSCDMNSIYFSEVKNSSFTNCKVYENGNGLFFENSSDIVFNSCSFENNTGSFSLGYKNGAIVMNNCKINHSYGPGSIDFTYNNCETSFGEDEEFDYVEEEEEEEESFNDQLYPWDKTKGELTLKDMETAEDALFLSDDDKRKLSNRYYSRAISMLMEHRDRCNEKDAQTTLNLLAGEPVTLKASELMGLTKVRSIQFTDYGVFIYDYFPCRFIKDNTSLIFNKYRGSQRKWGHLYRQEDKLLAFTGCYYIEGNAPTYFNDKQFLETGLMKKTQSGKIILLLMEDNKFEILEFAK